MALIRRTFFYFCSAPFLTHKRVCLDLHSVVRMKMLYKRWKTFWKINNHVEVERTELANELIRRKEVNFRRRLSEIACKSPYAATVEIVVVVNDKEKRRLDFRRCLLMS